MLGHASMMGHGLRCIYSHGIFSHSDAAACCRSVATQSVGPFDQNLHSLVSVCSALLRPLSAVVVCFRSPRPFPVPRLPSDPRMLRLPLMAPATGTVFSVRYDTGPTGLKAKHR
ncbi:hypothetical protein BKA56DRAFT_592227 [Ilyonectria sp. MPI-CAGE-AT-0026]|nr:hypothetical protein BKA56DRAFT_592227 [Ilyonectria sp. MPI-CAGE-AT-0026]